MDFLPIIIAFVVSAIISLVLMPWVLNMCNKNNLFDSQDERKVHKNKVPRLGGLIFVPSTAIGICSTLFLLSNYGEQATVFKTSTLIVGLGIFFIYLLGILDDLFGLSARLKFIVQLVAAICFPLVGLYFSSFYGLFGIWELPLYIAYPLTVLIVMIIVNSINLIDGIDGLASGLSLIAFICFLAIFWNWGNITFCIFVAAISGSLIVFMLYNLFGSAERRNKIFMGDSGSLILGYSLSYLALKNCWQCEQHPTSEFNLLVSFTLLIIPTFDLVRVALMRIMRGEHPFHADKTHVHHKLMRTGRYMRMTLLTIILADLLFIGINTGLYFAGFNITWIFGIDIALYILWQLYINHAIRRNDSRIHLEESLHAKFEENASKARKICILTPRFPLPENGGDVLRINNVARQLRKQGYQLILVSFEEDGEPQLYEARRLYNKVYTVHRNKWMSIIMSLLYILRAQPMQCGYYSSRKYRKMLRHVIETEKPDLYISHLLRMMPYLDELGLHDKSIIEMTDALSKTYGMSSQSKGSFFMRSVYRVERNLIRRAEQYAMLHFPKNVLVSQADIDYLSTISPHTRSLELHTNGVACIRHIPKHYDDHKIVFVGNMRTLQNQDAVLTFINDILPLILRHEPDTRFYIVGAQPPRHIQQLASNNIIVTGFVEDLEATISNACLCIAPVRVAAGIQNKVLVAMGCGLPVVLTSLIARAIPELKHEENCLIQDENATLADSCLRIMRHPELRAQFSLAGYDMVMANYSWKEKIKGYVHN